MSEETSKELKTILRKIQHIPFIIADGFDRETIVQKTKDISFDERSQLLRSIKTYPGTVLIDPGGLLEATIRIDDRHSKLSENRPLAYIQYRKMDSQLSHVEVIDILESVRSEATLIGHPVILCAIQHWQKLLMWEKYTIDKSIDSEKDLNKWFGYEISGKYIESARKNLTEIGKAMFESVRRNSISKESALALKIKNLKISDKNTYLHIAWDRLHSKYIDSTQDLHGRIKNIEEYLWNLPTSTSGRYLTEYPAEYQKYGVVETSINISTVIDFLKTAGSKFVYSDDENSTKSLRPQFRTFANAFQDWYFPVQKETIKKYQKAAQNEIISDAPYTAGWFSDSSSPIDVDNLLIQILCKPLVRFCEPIECSTSMLTSRKFTDLIVVACIHKCFCLHSSAFPA